MMTIGATVLSLLLLTVAIEGFLRQDIMCSLQLGGHHDCNSKLLTALRTQGVKDNAVVSKGACKGLECARRYATEHLRSRKRSQDNKEETTFYSGW
ncbi:hypothetical protein X975_04585, partial [Stegodyphus mimosarum]